MNSPSTLQNNVPWQPLIERVLLQQFQPTLLEVIDESSQHAGHAGASDSGMNSHFRVRIASSHFENLSRIQRHRLVYDSLQEFLDNGLHALAIEFR
jgi:BolA protein